MSLIKTLWSYTLGPRLFKIYKISWRPYEPHNLERWGDQVVVSFVTMWSISLYTIPLVATFLYQRSYSLADTICYLTKLVAGASVIFIASLAARGYSRANNQTYLKFIETLNNAREGRVVEAKRELNKYDFEFWAWPIDFDITEVQGDKNEARKALNRKSLRRQGGKELTLALPCKAISYIVAHTFALKLMYPGSVSILNWALQTTLLQGRIELLKQGGERFKLVAADRNSIDAMFIDRRHRSVNGDILVITCEGNCGFYENGIMGTPLSKGYSILGWNHPGFGGSSGEPYPEQEQNAIDCVMQFAMTRLGFSENCIVVHGWSIGGYTATWAAMNYPSIQSLILDATFDDVLPLAITKMPMALESIVRTVVREHLNLNIAEQLNRFDGPVMLIRRTDDEILCTPSNTLSGNRGNMLLAKLLSRRYPHVFSEDSGSAALLTKYLSSYAPVTRLTKGTTGIDEKRCFELVEEDLKRNSGIVRYPSTLGENCDNATKQQLALFLATMYMKDQNSTHCTPLAADLFQSGWDPAAAVRQKDYESRYTK